MASFKLCISDPSSGRTFQKEVKDSMTRPFIGLNIGETIKGDTFDFNGYEFQITGGSDYCGFPMRGGILGVRKRISVYGGVGFRGAGRGIKKRKTVCGHKIHERISQINLKVTKQGQKKLAEIFGVPEAQETQSVSGPQNREKQSFSGPENSKRIFSESEGFFREAKKEKAEAKEDKKEAKEQKTEEKKEAKERKAEEKPKEEKK